MLKKGKKIKCVNERGKCWKHRKYKSPTPKKYGNKGRQIKAVWIEKRN